MNAPLESPALVELANGVWLGHSPVSIVGMPLTATMAVLRLAGGELLLYSPVALTPARRAAVDALGRVAHLYAPNLFHHGWLGEWAAAYPTARVHAPAGLAKKRPELRIDRLHGSSPEAAFAGVIEELPIEGFRLQETALWYRPTPTLVVADLVQNVGRPTHPWAALYTRMMGFHDQVALSRAIRWTGFADRGAARRSVDAILGRDFERLVVGHGAPLVSGARDALEDAYAWLAP